MGTLIKMTVNYCRLVRHLVRYKLAKKLVPSYTNLAKQAVDISSISQEDTTLQRSCAYFTNKVIKTMVHYAFWEDDAQFKYDSLITATLADDDSKDEYVMHKLRTQNSLCNYSYLGRLFRVPIMTKKFTTRKQITE